MGFQAVGCSVGKSESLAAPPPPPPRRPAPHVLPEWSVAYVEQQLGSALAKCEVIAFLQQHAPSTFLRRWKLTGTTRSIKKTRNCAQLVAAYKVNPLLLLLHPTTQCQSFVFIYPPSNMHGSCDGRLVVA